MTFSSSLLPFSRLRAGSNLPIHGWPLAVLLVAWLLPGMMGHDPWKTDDAINLGIAHRMLSSGEWLVPNLAGDSYSNSPFYYWLAALLGKLLSTIPNWLAPHDAMRLASAVCLGTALLCIYRAARAFFDAELAYIAPLILAGSIGLLIVGHEAQPMLAVLAAYCAGFYALAILPKHPTKGAIVSGLAIAAAILTTSATIALPLLLLTLITPFFYTEAAHRWRSLAALGLTFFTVFIIAAPWFAKISAVAPDFLQALKTAEFERLSTPVDNIGQNLWGHISQLAWFAWPALPFALWSLWLISRGKCRHGGFTTPGIRIALLGFLLVCCVIGSFYSERNPAAILILPPLTLLALPGLTQLKRGAANAFDWLSMMTFSLFIIFAWLGWSGIYFGWPEQLAARAHVLNPGFEPVFDSRSILAIIASVIASLVWIGFIMYPQRSFARGITHWTVGLTVFWLSVATLWLPWINYGKSYRDVANSIVATLSGEQGCLVAVGLPDAQRASLDYFGLITQRAETVPDNSPESCNLLLLFSTSSSDDSNTPEKSPAGWVLLWQGARPGDSLEHFQLYRRQPGGDKSAKNRPSNTTPSAGKPSGGSDSVNKPSGSSESADKPSGGSDSADKPSGGNDPASP